MALHFGLLPQGDRAELTTAFEEFVTWLGKRSGQEITPHPLRSYEELAEALEGRVVQLAWVPPLVHIRTDPRAAVPLVSARRNGKGTFEAVLVVPEDSPLKTEADLARVRAAWVDPWSATGFVVPRLELSERGYDPRKLFRSETFCGSHRSCITALTEGAADVAGTFARFDGTGDPESGGWGTVPGAKVRVLARFGEVPTDVVCAAASIDGVTLKKLEEAFVHAGKEPEVQAMLRTVFNADEFTPRVEGNYGDLRRRFDRAQRKGLFGA
jgi:phosphate/phosphite/phosphonate ABC transporter binding protein